MNPMARQELDHSLEAEQERLQKLWDAYKAQEDELVATQKELEAAAAKEGKLNAKLAKEEERLQKLWDAYRVQEQELKDLKERIPLMEEKLIERERTIQSLQRDVALLEPLTKKGKAAAELQRENERLQTEVDVLTEKVKHTSTDASKEAKALKKAEADLQKEQERLKKLYALHQETEADNQELRKTIKEWEAWAKKVQAS